ncbi:hypothetical protein JXB41_01485 [Candidatus Woesearchaeota archaeon]|nr:hypothetical protein [Candidatus Woesearchaeota archaeon]
MLPKDMKNKRAQSLALRTIIVAILLVVVLVVLLFIFTGKARLFNSASRSCISQQGICKEKCEFGETSVFGTDCEDSARKCCLSIFQNTSS